MSSGGMSSGIMSRGSMTNAPNGRAIALLAWCEPWLVALAVSNVRRIALGDDVQQIEAAVGDSPWLGTVDAGNGRIPAWDLGRLLGFAGGGLTWIIIDQPLPAALRVGRCLHVVDLARQTPQARPAVFGSGPGFSCFRADDLTTGVDPTPDFGLLVDPCTLLAGVTSGARR